MGAKYQVISGIIRGIVGSIITAQGDKFGDIECTSLRVVDADGILKSVARYH